MTLAERFFKEELEVFENDDIQEFCIELLDTAPTYFFHSIQTLKHNECTGIMLFVFPSHSSSSKMLPLMPKASASSVFRGSDGF
mgnify:CR=1 FL=1